MKSHYTKLIFLLFLINIFSVFGQVQVGDNIVFNYSKFSFATSVSIADSGTRVIVGGYGLNQWGSRVYDWNGSNWVQLGNDIDVDFPNDTCHYNVSISSNGNIIALVSVINEGSGDYGYVKIYELLEGNWIQLGNVITGEYYSDFFGSRLSLSANGNRIVIGAKFSYNSNGSAEVYEYNGNDWVQLGNDLVGDDFGNGFGVSSALSFNGNRIIVGGLLFGIGWAIAGFCPGTSIGALAEGRIHAIWAILGMLGGAALYVEAYPMMKKTLLVWGSYGKITLPQVLGISPWPIIGVFAVFGIVFFVWIEIKGL
jgi:uncharacterized membrane protein YedE/YeeE